MLHKNVAQIYAFHCRGAYSNYRAVDVNYIFYFLYLFGGGSLFNKIKTVLGLIHHPNLSLNLQRCVAVR